MIISVRFHQVLSERSPYLGICMDQNTIEDEAMKELVELVS
jgi:hypothetical protein